MSIAQKVKADLIAARKAHDNALVSCLRLVKNALENEEKNLRRALAPEEEIQVLKTLAKQRREAIEMFTKGGRQDLADKEAGELKRVESYPPSSTRPRSRPCSARSSPKCNLRGPRTWAKS